MKLKLEDEIAHVSAVLVSRGVNVDKIFKEYKTDKIKPEDQLKGLTGALYDGLAYGNWPK